MLEEIFYLGYYLHWSRQDILELPIQERRRYLDLLTKQLEREYGTGEHDE